MEKNRIKRKEQKDDNLAIGAKGGGIAFILKISNSVLAFINQVLLAQILGTGGIGEVILAITLVRISAQIAKFGMEETLMKFIPLYVDQKNDSGLKGTISFSLKFCFLFSVVFMLLVLICSKYIAINIFHSEGLLKLIPVIALSIPAWVIRDVIGGILKGYKDALRALIPESIISPFFKIVIFLVLTLKGISPLYAVIAFVAGEVLSVIVAIKFLLNKVRDLKHVKAKYENKKVLDVAYTIIFTSMSIILYTQADIWILGMFASTDTVGIYGISAKLVILVSFPMIALGAVIPSLISSIHSSGNLKELRRVVRESTRWILSIAMPIILILILEGRYILNYCYGSEFEAGYIVLVILTIGQMIKAGSGMVGILFQMTGEHKIYMKINIIFGILNIILNLIFVPLYGMLGAAVATSFCLSMVDIISIFVIHKRLSVLTLAKGLSFDLLFIAVVLVIYVVLIQSNYYILQHILLIIALTVYFLKSIYNHDIPWQILSGKLLNK